MDNAKEFKVKEHVLHHEPMEMIECDIMLMMNEIYNTIEESQKVSVKNFYDEYEIKILKKQKLS